MNLLERNCSLERLHAGKRPGHQGTPAHPDDFPPMESTTEIMGRDDLMPLRRLKKKRREIAALVTVVAMGVAGPTACRSAEIPPPPRNVKAQDFMNTFGVNIHFGENGYRNVQAIADALNTVGFRRVRISCVNESEIAQARELAAKTAAYFPEGLKADVLIIGYMNAAATPFAAQQKTIPQIADLIETIEGPNEINNYFTGKGTHGPADTTDQTKNFGPNSLSWAKAIAHWKKSTPALEHAKVIAPCIASGDPKDYALLSNVAEFVDAGTVHFYAGNGRQPSNFGGGNFPTVCRWYQAAAAPGKPLAISEGGQTTAGKPGQGGCNEMTQARYMLNQLCDATADGIYRLYVYQLMDGTPDGDPTGNEGSEAHFGIFDYQWHPKPAAQAIANVKTLLRDAGTDFTPRVPTYNISGVANPGLAGSSFTISKSDGSTFIVVWNEPQIWDPKTNAPVTPPTDNATVSFDHVVSYQVYNPMTGPRAIASGHGSKVTIDLRGSPLMIRIVPEG